MSSDPTATPPLTDDLTEVEAAFNKDQDELEAGILVHWREYLRQQKLKGKALSTGEDTDEPDGALSQD